MTRGNNSSIYECYLRDQIYLNIVVKPFKNLVLEET